MDALANYIFNGSLEYQRSDKFSMDVHAWYFPNGEQGENKYTMKKYGLLGKYFLTTDGFFIALGGGLVSIKESTVSSKFNFKVLDIKIGHDYYPFNDNKLIAGYTLGYMHSLTNDQKIDGVTIPNPSNFNIGLIFGVKF